MQIIPKISLLDKSTWVNEKVTSVCISSVELIKGVKYLKDEYFEGKQIILSGIIPDDFPFTYVELLDKYLPKSIYPEKFRLTTSDCATYEDSSREDIEDQLFMMEQENWELFKKYKDYRFIYLLKGVTAKDYLSSINDARSNGICDLMIYLTGYIRSNPKHFDCYTLLKSIVHSLKGTNIPIWFYGCNPKTANRLSELREQWNIRAVISETYRNRAVYKGNKSHSRTSRMKAGWRWYLRKFK